jgi:hypothetical protein
LGVSPATLDRKSLVALQRIEFNAQEVPYLV